MGELFDLICEMSIGAVETIIVLEVGVMGFSFSNPTSTRWQGKGLKSEKEAHSAYLWYLFWTIHLGGGYCSGVTHNVFCDLWYR